MRRARRVAPVGLQLSFLDCICCGFGAIVLLLVLTKIGEPRTLERAREDLDRRVARLEQELREIRSDSATLAGELEGQFERLAREREAVRRLTSELSEIEQRFAASQQEVRVQDVIEGRLLAARQELTEEMRRLAEPPRRRPLPPSLVGGIPVDSEYIVFVIDTSGSMHGFTWSLVVEKMGQTLEAYPRVKGIQVMNDEGQYMFPQYAGKWIPDTPARRRAVLERLRTWEPFSNSSPVEGVIRAIRTFGATDKSVSVYVFGDEFTGPSITEVVDEVARINPHDASGRPRVRIHALGFPVLFAQRGPERTGERFAALMRELCQRNGGTFVGLNEIQP